MGVGAQITQQACAGNVPGAPQRSDLIGIIDGDILKGIQRIFICAQIITAVIPTHNTAVAGIVNTGIAIKQGNIFKQHKVTNALC
jgi:hypothetical protein